MQINWIPAPYFSLPLHTFPYLCLPCLIHALRLCICFFFTLLFRFNICGCVCPSACPSHTNSQNGQNLQSQYLKLEKCKLRIAASYLSLPICTLTNPRILLLFYFFFFQMQLPIFNGYFVCQNELWTIKKEQCQF